MTPSIPDSQSTLKELALHHIDFLKHITTLSTGSIVVEATFLGKIFQHPKWKAFAAISLICFTLSILGALRFHLEIIAREFKQWPERQRTLAYVSILMAILGFFCGVLALAIFAVRNLFAL